MKIEICYSPHERGIESITLDIAENISLSVALPIILRDMVASQSLVMAVWGRVVNSDYKLQAGDRVELLRDLRVDPKTARRERFAKQGIKTAGLFKKRRVGAKAGY